MGHFGSLYRRYKAPYRLTRKLVLQQTKTQSANYQFLLGHGYVTRDMGFLFLY